MDQLVDVVVLGPVQHVGLVHHGHVLAGIRLEPFNTCKRVTRRSSVKASHSLSASLEADNEELNNRYAKPIGRHLPSMKIERMVWAEKV